MQSKQGRFSLECAVDDRLLCSSPLKGNKSRIFTRESERPMRAGSQLQLHNSVSEESAIFEDEGGHAGEAGCESEVL